MANENFGEETLYGKMPRLEEVGYVKVACRLCGDEYLFSPKMAKLFDSEHAYECIYCRRLNRVKI